MYYKPPANRINPQNPQYICPYVLCVQVSHVYIPRQDAENPGKRTFAFVTFGDVNTARALIGQFHTVKGVTVHVGQARPKSEIERMKAVQAAIAAGMSPQAAAAAAAAYGPPSAAAYSPYGRPGYDPYSAAYGANPYAAMYSAYAQYGSYYGT